MLRFCGCALIVFLGTIVGISRSLQYKTHTRMLRKLSSMLSSSADMIRYKRSTVGEILGALRSDSENAMILDRPDTVLRTEECEIVKDFLDQLGTTDAEGQLAMISLCRSRCEDFKILSEKEEAAKCRLSEELGFMCGAFIAVLLI